MTTATEPEPSDVCECGHKYEDHDIDGSCLFVECDCTEFEEQDDD
jgi:hypothetical protein